MSELTQHEKSESTQMTAIKWAIGVLIIGMGVAINISLGASDKSDSALDKTAQMSGDIGVIKENIKSLNTNVGEIKDYFKLTPKDAVLKQINLNVK